jgi:hypothetical protein
MPLWLPSIRHTGPHFCDQASCVSNTTTLLHTCSTHSTRHTTSRAEAPRAFRRLLPVRPLVLFLIKRYRQATCVLSTQTCACYQTLVSILIASSGAIHNLTSAKEAGAKDSRAPGTWYRLVHQQSPGAILLAVVLVLPQSRCPPLTISALTPSAIVPN